MGSIKSWWPLNFTPGSTGHRAVTLPPSTPKLAETDFPLRVGGGHQWRQLPLLRKCCLEGGGGEPGPPAERFSPVAATRVPRSPRSSALPLGMSQALLLLEGKRVGSRAPLKRWWLEDGARRGLNRPRSAPALRQRPEQRRQDRGAQGRRPEDAEEPDKERRKDWEARKQRRQRRGEQARASPRGGGWPDAADGGGEARAGWWELGPTDQCACWGQLDGGLEGKGFCVVDPAGVGRREDSKYILFSVWVALAVFLVLLTPRCVVHLGHSLWIPSRPGFSCLAMAPSRKFSVITFLSTLSFLFEMIRGLSGDCWVVALSVRGQ